MNNVVILTGGSGGLGRGAAAALAKSGDFIVLNYNKNRKAAEEIADEAENFGGHCRIFGADITVFAEADDLMSFALSEYGKIDALVNNAGIALPPMPFDMTSGEDWKEIFSVNVFGTFNCTKAVIPHMVSRKKGSIVNISSVWGLTGGSCEAVYSASKAAIIGFTKAMAKELAPSNIRVNAVAPGIIDTKMNSHLSQAELDEIKKEIPLGRIGTDEDIGKAVEFLCNDESGYITGEIIKADGGWI